MKSPLTWREVTPLASLNLLRSNRECEGGGLGEVWGRAGFTGKNLHIKPGAEEGLETNK